MRYLILFFLLITSICFSQTEVRGTITDQNNEPVAFANVLFKDSNTGTVTDENGQFFLESDKNYTHIIISFVGFETLTIELSSNVVKNLKIRLKEDSSKLEEVVLVSKPKVRLKKKENPAYRILQGIWKNKRKNGLDLVKQYQYQQYQATEFGINNIDTVFMKRVLKNSFDSIVKSVENFRKGKKFYMPLYLSEVMTDVYGNNVTNKKVELIKGTKNTGVNQQGFFLDILRATFQNVDISKNAIVLFNKPFINPLATTGFGTYDYLLKDSSVVNNEKQYRIYFFPREEGDLAFNGNFVVGKNFSIKQITMILGKKANLNLIRSLTLEKSFIIKNDSIYVPKEDYFEADLTAFTKGDNEKGATIKETKIYKDYIFDQPKEVNFYNQTQVIYNPVQLEKGEDYWTAIRDEGSKQNANSAKIIKSIKNAKSVKRISNIAQVLFTGYIPIGGWLEYGSLFTTIGNNNVEGTRFRAGLRTFRTAHDRFSIATHLAYGTKDKEFKYGLGIDYVLAYKPRLTVGASYAKEVEQLGAQLLNPRGLFGNSFGSQSLFTTGNNFFLSKTNRYKTTFGYEPAKNFLITLTGEFMDIKSASPQNFSIDYIDNSGNLKSDVKDSSLKLNLMFTPGRNVFGYGIRRRFGRNLFPTFIASYKKGLRGVFNSDFSYDKLQLYYNQPIVLSNLGVLDATLEFGKTFGKVPLSLLNVIPGNQSLTIRRNTFALMNYYEFITDTYVTGHFIHRFNGVLFNRIPLIKKLKLRGLLIFRGAWGTISQDNIAINRSATFTTYNAPKNKLYYEYGFGVENIGAGNLRMFRLDFVWRGSYKNNPGFDVSTFGIRLGIRPRF